MPKGRKRKRKTIPPQSSNIEFPQETVLSQEIQILKDKMIGEYKVEQSRLSLAHSTFRCRELDETWIKSIKRSIREAPGTLITKLPALLDPSVVKDPSQFNVEMVHDECIAMFLLGGNHLLSACSQLLQEEGDNEVLAPYREFHIELYVGLSPEEGKLVGNLHNKRATKKDINFQNQVRQARAIYLRDETGDQWRNTSSVVLSHLQQKDCPKDNLSVVFGLASLPDDVFQEVERIFRLWGSENVPQQLFKSLLGLHNDVVIQYLRRVEERKDAKSVSEVVKKEKSRNTLKRVFTERTGCSSWEEAEMEFLPYVHIIDNFLDTNVNQKSVPTNFIRACDAARQRTPPKEDTCIVKVTIDGEDLPQRIQRLIASDVLKFQRRIENKIRGLRN